MNTELRYALYHFKKTVFRFVLMILYSIVVVNASIHSSYFTYSQGSQRVEVNSFSLDAFGVNILILGFLVAILEFAEFKNRRNLDTWFSFPLNRWKIGLIHFINGAVQLIVAHTISYIWGYLKISVYFNTLPLDKGIFFTSYFVILATGLVFYGFTIFPFMIANNTFDGVIFTVFYTVLPFISIGVLFETMLEYTGLRDLFKTDMCYGVISVVYGLTDHYSYNFMSTIRKTSMHAYETVDCVWIAIWLIVGIAFTVLGIWVFNSQKTEKIGGISDSIFGYKLLIPVTMLLIILGTGGEPGIGLLAGLFTLILYVVFRRGIKLHIPDIVVIVVITILANIPYNYAYEIADIFR